MRLRPIPTVRSLRAGRDAFTLVELIVVVTIILLVVVIALPNVASMFDDAKMTDARNIVRGLLVTTRQKSMQGDKGERGLLFALDATGTQRVYPIGQVSGDILSKDVFEILDESERKLSRPVRAVPRYVIEEGGETYEQFSEAELANDDFDVTPSAADTAQRHRNFFTIIFANDGQLIVRRNVLVIDTDADDDDRGDRTGLRVADDVAKFFTHSPNGDIQDIDITGQNRTLDDVIADADGTAINFVSIDGLLVYDDSLFNELESAADKREFLLESATPFYVNRNSGDVILGDRIKN